MRQNKGLFLDRDGVINNNNHSPMTYDPAYFVLNEGVIEFLRIAGQKDYLIVIISNQGGISLGHHTLEQTENVHDFFLEMMKKNHINIAEIYYCTHHHTNEKCICRKPNTQMLEKAMARFQINPEKSLFFGDQITDQKAGLRAGIKNSILIEPNENLMDYAKLL